MAKKIIATGIPKDEVDDMVTTLQNLGATDVKKTKDGTQDGEDTFTVQGNLPS